MKCNHLLQIVSGRGTYVKRNDSNALADEQPLSRNDVEISSTTTR